MLPLYAFQEIARQKIILEQEGESGRARSGLIFLPSRSGKRRIALTAAAEIGGRIAVLCKDGDGVENWVTQFKTWSTAQNSKITN